MSDDSLHNKLNKSDMLQSEEAEFRIENKEDLVRHLVIHIPVSYTHLDVYKRQPIYSPSLKTVTLSQI